MMGKWNVVLSLGLSKKIGKTKEYRDEYMLQLYDCVIIDAEARIYCFKCFEFELARGGLH